ncbi:MAG: SPOR domain-containing protein [Magnetococcales bacterium]|nr:SPOR domain-containing protein [Magnetococcales bacterium]
MLHLPDADADAMTFLKALLCVFDVDAKVGDTLPTHGDLLAAMERWAAQGRRILVAVDRAELLDGDNLEVLKMVASYQWDGRHPLQLLLVGRLESASMALDPRFCGLVPLLVGTVKLDPLNAEDMAGYVRFHLDRHGLTEWKLTQGGWRTLQRESGGIPRRINRVMSAVMFQLGDRRAARVGGFTIRRAASAAGGAGLQVPRLRWRVPFGTSAAKTEVRQPRLFALRHPQGTRPDLDRWLIRLAGVGVLIAVAGLVWRAVLLDPEAHVTADIDGRRTTYGSDITASAPGGGNPSTRTSLPVVVRVAAFNQRHDATTLMSGLFQKGYRAYLYQGEYPDGSAWFEVRVNFPDPSQAGAGMERLERQEGLVAEVVGENTEQDMDRGEK